MIESYKFGQMTIDGTVYKSDLFIHRGRVNDNWWRKEGHLLCMDDLDAILKFPPQALLVGTGASGMMKVPDDVIKDLEYIGVETVAMKTGEAWHIYNRLYKENSNISGAFHLTC